MYTSIAIKWGERCDDRPVFDKNYHGEEAEVYD
jgi:hypothetical protein